MSPPDDLKPFGQVGMVYLLTEHFVAGLPEPLLKSLREQILKAIAAFYVDGPDGRGLPMNPTALVERPETLNEGRLRELADALLESGKMDDSLARSAMVPAGEVEILAQRLLTISHLTDLLLILGREIKVSILTDEPDEMFALS